MDAANLDQRLRTYDGWIPPTVADLLHEHGHHGLLQDAAARGDWYCAHRLARAAAEPGPDGQAAALALLEPFVAVGWWPAISAVAGLLTDWKRIDEAVALLRPLADTGHREAVRELARLLAQQGQIDAVVALLGPRCADPLFAGELVELAAGHGRDTEIAALLPALSAGRADPFAKPRSDDDWDAIPLHAEFLERQGRIDEAAALLSRKANVFGVTQVGHPSRLADLLARHGREAELRTFAVETDDGYALAALVRLLEGQARIPEAVALLQESVRAGNPHATFDLAELLARHGRHNEAVEVLRPIAETADGDPDWIILLLRTILVDAGRADDALASIDDFFDRHGGAPHERALARADVLNRCGRSADADAELGPFAIPDDDLRHSGTVDGTIALAERLVRQGKPQEALAHLRGRLDKTEVLRRDSLR